MFPSRAWHRALLPALLLFPQGGAPATQSSSERSREPSAPAPIPVGINLRPITAYDRGWVFVDAMKMASEWRYEEGRTGPPTRKYSLKGRAKEGGDVVPIDPDGWPRPASGRAIACDFFVGMRGKFPAGEYVVTWKGKGRLEFRGHIGIVSESPNRLVLNVDAINGGQPGLRLSEVDSADPIRDIHVWMPGHEDSCHAFHPLFLERLSPFSVLRFYPWMRVYTSSGRWSERTTRVSARQGNPQGVAAEFMIELCNDVRAEPWFCIPHVADDEYVRNFATLVRDALRHDAKVYVEFSNETWNTDFMAGRWAREEGMRRGVPAMQIVAERSSQVFAIWHEVFGAQSNRIVRVAGVQLHNPGIGNALCRALDGNFDAIAVGAYFGARADRNDVDKSSTAAELMATGLKNLNQIVLPRIEEHRAMAQTFAAELGRPISLLTYEGGQSIVARSPGGGLGVDATLECQRMPEMYDAYRALIEGAQARGVELFVGYDFAGPRNSADTYSVLEYIGEPLGTAVKYRALIEGWESRGQ